MAIGGYGRAELNPYSDIDFMFLHDGQVAAGKPLPYLSRLIDGVLYPLWDIGLKIGYAVRSIDDCVKVANTDMQSKTSLIEARLIIGDEKLFKKFQRTLIDKCVDGFEEKYIALRIEDQRARHSKFGNSACMQEPNIKNGCGGLRDFQNLLWMAFFKYRARSLDDLEKQEFVSRVERRQLDAAYDFLLRARTELHYQTNRAVDVLGKNLQPAVALGLGYGDRSPSKRIEKFMRDLYTHMRNIFLITRTLEQRMALLAPAQGKLSLRAWLPKRKRAGTGGWLSVCERRNPRRFPAHFPGTAPAPDARFSASPTAAAEITSRPGAADPQRTFPGGPRFPERRPCAGDVSDHSRTARQRRARFARHARGEFPWQIHPRIRETHLPRAA